MGQTSGPSKLIRGLMRQTDTPRGVCPCLSHVMPWTE